MRIRLRIERNELPTVSVLWTFTTTQLSETVSQFMARVNERFPLEGNTWGFEDYAVSLGGYEAQHYCEVGAAFEKDDEVLIKPLQYVEKRARTITGRDQISGDGRHLIDGVPFGRPLLKRVKRPEIVIPPRKRQRVEGGNALVRFEEVEGEDDGEFEEFEDEDGSLAGRLAAEDAGFAYREEDGELDEVGDSEDDDDEDDADFGADETDDVSGDSSEVSSEEDSESESDDDSSSDDSSSDDSDDSASKHPVKGASTAAKDSSKPPDTNVKKPVSLPYEGDSRTKARNARKRDSNRLKFLKEAGKLPGTASLADMKEWLKTNPVPDRHSEVAADNQKKLEEKRQQLLADIAGGGIDVTSANDQLKVDLTTAVDAEPSTKDQSSDDEGPEELPIGAEPTSQIEEAPPKVQLPAATAEELPEPTSTLKRARINLAGANRLVFGSLGLRTPKTQAEKDALQKKLAARPKKAAPASELARVEKPVEEEEDPNAWREKVAISAVECVDEGVTLSAPPFPFEQRWDPQYRNNNKKRTRNSALYNAAKRSKKRKTNGEDFVETYDKYNQDGGGDALNYDDEEDEFEDFGDDEYWEEGALLDGDEDEAEEENNGFPPLPEDLSTLKSLTEEEAAVGDFIVFTEMACSAATSWQPQMLSQRAKLREKLDYGGLWGLLLPPQGKKEYDEEGNRVYKKFEMEGFDEEDEKTEKFVVWAELTDVRLLQRGENGVQEA